MHTFSYVLNPIFATKVPGLKAFSTLFLDANYSKNKDEVNNMLNKTKYLNIITIKLNNQSHNQVINLYINIVDLGFYYIKLAALKGESFTAKIAAN